MAINILGPIVYPKCGLLERNIQPHFQPRPSLCFMQRPYTCLNASAFGTLGIWLKNEDKRFYRKILDGVTLNSDFTFYERLIKDTQFPSMEFYFGTAMLELMQLKLTCIQALKSSKHLVRTLHKTSLRPVPPPFHHFIYK